jgi:hypothetical protein
MKQLTTTQLPVVASEVTLMEERAGRVRSPLSGFEVTLGRAGIRRRMLERLRPQGGFIPLDLDLLEVVAELDPGMIDWQADSIR